MRFLSFFLLFCLFLTSCNRKSAGKEDAADLRLGKAAKVIRKLDDNRFTVPYLEAKARVKVESPQLTIGGTAVIRLTRDEAIWVSIKKFGFEGARALIRPDSFFVVNRLNGDYTAEPLAYIEEKYKIPARFDLLQEMVLGNAVFFSRDLQLTTVGDDYALAGTDRRFATRHLIDGHQYQLLEMELTELAQQRKLRVKNEDFRPVEELQHEQSFAYARTIEVEAGPQSGNFTLDYTRLNFAGPFAMPFRRQ